MTKFGNERTVGTLFIIPHRVAAIWKHQGISMEKSTENFTQAHINATELFFIHARSSNDYNLSLLDFPSAISSFVNYNEILKNYNKFLEMYKGKEVRLDFWVVKIV